MVPALEVQAAERSARGAHVIRARGRALQIFMPACCMPLSLVRRFLLIMLRVIRFLGLLFVIALSPHWLNSLSLVQGAAEN